MATENPKDTHEALSILISAAESVAPSAPTVNPTTSPVLTEGDDEPDVDALMPSLQQALARMFLVVGFFVACFVFFIKVYLASRGDGMTAGSSSAMHPLPGPPPSHGTPVANPTAVETPAQADTSSVPPHQRRFLPTSTPLPINQDPRFKANPSGQRGDIDS